MTEKRRYVLQAFKQYNANKKALGEKTFDGIRSIDYTKPVRGFSPYGLENALISHIAEKTELEKQVMLVERTIWYYEIDGGKKAEYIRLRWIKGYPIYRVAMDCYIGETTAKTWGKEILERAEAVADMYHLF